MNRSIPPVQVILEAMKGLLDMRRSGKIKRITFLKTWGKLRAYLTLTKEYQLWRFTVKERAGGACEECGEIGAHSHHIVPISRDVDKALDLANGRFLCVRCHSGQPDHNMRRTGAKKGYRGAQRRQAVGNWIKPAHSPNPAERDSAPRPSRPSREAAPGTRAEGAAPNSTARRVS